MGEAKIMEPTNCFIGVGIPGRLATNCCGINTVTSTPSKKTPLEMHSEKLMGAFHEIQVIRWKGGRYKGNHTPGDLEARTETTTSSLCPRQRIGDLGEEQPKRSLLGSAAN